MNILVITQELGVSCGWDRYSLDMVRTLRDSGHTVGVLAIGGEKDFTLTLTKPSHFRLLGYTSYIKAFWFYIVHRKKLEQYDAIHCFIEPYAPFAMYLAKLLSKPFFITMHGSYSVRNLQNNWFGKLQKEAYRAAKKIICVSTYTESVLLKRIPLTNTTVIPNGVYNSLFKKRTEISNTNVILGVGALKYRKGFHLVVEAMSEVVRTIPNATYNLVGDDSDTEYKDALQKRIEELDLKNSVHILGQISEEKLHAIYNKASVFVLTSVSTDNDFEGFGLVFLEANAIGVPVIGMKGSGAEDAIKDGYSGVLAEKNNITDLATKIIEVLSNQTLSHNLVKNGEIWANNHDWSKIIKRYLGVYSD